MNIVFLDIDGVLNNQAWFQACHDADPGAFRDFPNKHLDPVLCQRLQEALEPLDIKIVISSSWRIILKVEEIQAVFEKKGLRIPIIGITPSKRYPGEDRGREIATWLKHNIPAEDLPATRIAILDDDTDMGTLLPWLVHCPLGFLPEQIEMLNRVISMPLGTDVPWPENLKGW